MGRYTGTMSAGWQTVGQVVNRTVRAGPELSPDRAQAAVTRVRRAAEWAWAHERLTDPPPIVADRHGAIEALALDLDRAPGLRAPQTARSFLKVVRGWRPLSASLQSSFWRPGGEKRVLLVAPNIWVRGRDQYFDQGDYARLTALRAAKWASLLQENAWIQPLVLGAIARVSVAGEDVVRTALFLDQVVENRLAYISPRTIPSINWLRKYHAPLAAHSFARLPGVSRVSLLHKHQQVLDFVEETRLFQRGGEKWLLGSPGQIPTEKELMEPQLWLQRMRRG